jgi:hypothetical protein
MPTPAQLISVPGPSLGAVRITGIGDTSTGGLAVDGLLDSVPPGLNAGPVGSVAGVGGFTAQPDKSETTTSRMARGRIETVLFQRLREYQAVETSVAGDEFRISPGAIPRRSSR